jgi:thioredoxin
MDIKYIQLQEKIKNSKQPILIEFWASWCPPCITMDPIINELEKELTGNVDVLTLNTDRNPQSKITYNIQGLPTFIIFIEGHEIRRLIGSKSKEQLKDFIKSTVE